MLNFKLKLEGNKKKKQLLRLKLNTMFSIILKSDLFYPIWIVDPGVLWFQEHQQEGTED